MKLLLIVVPRNHQKELRKELLDASFQLTRFESEGGFLRKRNDTFLLGVDDDRVDEAVGLVKKICAPQNETISAPVLSSTDVAESVMASDAATITTGGATVFVLGIERFEKA